MKKNLIKLNLKLFIVSDARLVIMNDNQKNEKEKKTHVEMGLQ